MRILIVGAGAVGGYFGARLAQAGRDVTFLVRPARAKQIRDAGLRIASPHGDAVISPVLISSVEIAEHYDIILLSVKAYALERALEDFAAAVGPDTMILPMLNGMAHLDALSLRFGKQAVIGGVAVIAAELESDGRIVQLFDVQQMIYGELSGCASARLAALDETMQGAGFEAVLSANVVQALWDKWVQLASLGATTCLLRGTIGEVEAAPGGTTLALEALAECAAIAAAAGHEPSDAMRARFAALITAPGSTLTSSMYRDMRAGAAVEVDQVLGDLLERGRAHGVKTLLLEAAFVALRIYQAALFHR